MRGGRPWPPKRGSSTRHARRSRGAHALSAAVWRTCWGSDAPWRDLRSSCIETAEARGTTRRVFAPWSEENGPAVALQSETKPMSYRDPGRRRTPETSLLRPVIHRSSFRSRGRPARDEGGCRFGLVRPAGARLRARTDYSSRARLACERGGERHRWCPSGEELMWYGPSVTIGCEA